MKRGAIHPPQGYLTLTLPFIPELIALPAIPRPTNAPIKTAIPTKLAEMIPHALLKTEPAVAASKKVKFSGMLPPYVFRPLEFSDVASWSLIS